MQLEHACMPLGTMPRQAAVLQPVKTSYAALEVLGQTWANRASPAQHAIQALPDGPLKALASKAEGQPVWTGRRPAQAEYNLGLVSPNLRKQWPTDRPQQTPRRLARQILCVIHQMNALHLGTNAR